jgi:hypothetical protein
MELSLFIQVARDNFVELDLAAREAKALEVYLRGLYSTRSHGDPYLSCAGI